MRTLLLGWGASTPRRLAPFERLHRDLGHETRLFICDGIGSLLRYDRVRRACEAEAHALASWSHSDDVIVHLFSDNGFIALCTLVDALRRGDEGRRTIERIRGVVLDSAPGLHAASPPNSRGGSRLLSPP